MFKRKFHWYSFTIVSGETTSSITQGYKRNYVSRAQITAAKRAAGHNAAAVLLSCCYLGRMTVKTMEG